MAHGRANDACILQDNDHLTIQTTENYADLLLDPKSATATTPVLWASNKGVYWEVSALGTGQLATLQQVQQAIGGTIAGRKTRPTHQRTTPLGRSRRERVRPAVNDPPVVAFSP